MRVARKLPLLRRAITLTFTLVLLPFLICFFFRHRQRTLQEPLEFMKLGVLIVLLIVALFLAAQRRPPSIARLIFYKQIRLGGE